MSTQFVHPSYSDLRKSTSIAHSTFYMHGVTSHILTTSMFHPSVNLHNRWKSTRPYDCGTCASSSSHGPPFLVEMTHQESNDWMDFEQHYMDPAVDSPYDDEPFVSKTFVQPTRSNAWSTVMWDPPERVSSCLWAEHSPTEPAPLPEDTFGDFCSGDQQQQYNIPDSPFSFQGSSRSTYAAFRKTPSSVSPSRLPQPHETAHGIPIQSSSSSLSSFSSSSPSISESSSQTSLGSSPSQTLDRHVQATSSPLTHSPLISSSTPSPSPSPELISHISIPILQPRPYRRIPIISLSELASACDRPWHQPPSSGETEKAPQKFPSSPEFTQPHTYTNAYPPRGKHLNNAWYNGGVRAICSCGCTESEN